MLALIWTYCGWYISQLEWKEEITQKFSSVKKERSGYPRLEDDLLQRRRQELQYVFCIAH